MWRRLFTFGALAVSAICARCGEAVDTRTSGALPGPDASPEPTPTLSPDAALGGDGNVISPPVPDVNAPPHRDASLDVQPDVSAPIDAAQFPRAGEPCSGELGTRLAGTCAPGALCVVPHGATGSSSGAIGTCQSEASGQCDCGVVFDDRCEGHASCYCGAGGDTLGICLTPAERAIQCASAARESFRGCDEAPAPVTAWQECADVECFCEGLAACAPVTIERSVTRGRIGERVCGVRDDVCVTTYYAVMGSGFGYRCEFPLGTACGLESDYVRKTEFCVMTGATCSLTEGNCTDLLACD